MDEDAFKGAVYRHSKPTKIYQDKLGNICWMETVQGLPRIKHICIKYHVVKEEVEDKTIQILFTPSTETPAHFFKALVGDSFKVQRSCLGVIFL